MIINGLQRGLLLTEPHPGCIPAYAVNKLYNAKSQRHQSLVCSSTSDDKYAARIDVATHQRFSCYQPNIPIHQCRIRELKAKAKQLSQEQQRIEDEIQNILSTELEEEPDPEDIARMLEEGGDLPPIPAHKLLAEPEPAEQFKARIEASIEEFNRRIQGNRSKGDDPPGLIFDVLKDAKQGGRTEKWEPVDDSIEDIDGTIPAPELPPRIEEQTKKVQQIMYVLRRAHLGTTPSAAASALIEKELIADNSVYEDPWVGLSGTNSYKDYMEKLDALGVTLEISKVFASCYAYTPEPQWRVVADTFVHIPIPYWYYKYLALHASTVTGPQVEQRVATDYQADAATLYPRYEMTESHEEASGTAHLRWLPTASNGDQASIAASRELLSIVNPSSIANELFEGTISDNNQDIGMLQSGIFARFDSPPTRNQDYRPVEYKTTALGCSINTILQPEWNSTETLLPETAQPPVPPKKRVFDPEAEYFITPDEAEYLLRHWFGDKFDDIVAQMPKRGLGPSAEEDPGGRWKQLDQGVFTVAMTWRYEINSQLGQVDSVHCYWGDVGGSLIDVRDAYDIFVHQLDILQQ